MEQQAQHSSEKVAETLVSTRGYLRFSARQKRIFVDAFATTTYWSCLSSKDRSDREAFYDAEQYLRKWLRDAWFYDVLANDPYRQAVLLTAFDNAPYFATYVTGDRRARAAMQRTAELMAAKLQSAFGVHVPLPSALGGSVRMAQDRDH